MVPNIPRTVQRSGSASFSCVHAFHVWAGRVIPLRRFSCDVMAERVLGFVMVTLMHEQLLLIVIPMTWN